MKKKGVAVTVPELVQAIEREYSRKGSATGAFSGEGVIKDDGALDVRKLGTLSETRLKTIYKRLAGREYEKRS